MTFDHAIRISKYLLHNQGFVVAKYQNQTKVKAEVFQNLVCLFVSIYLLHNVR
jgi:carbon starvation protein CstA